MSQKIHLTYANKLSWLQVIQYALDEEGDTAWLSMEDKLVFEDDIKTAMAWLCDELNVNIEEL